MSDYADALRRVRNVDPDADYAIGEPDVLLVAREYADTVLALFPGAYEDPNPEHLSFTRIVLPPEEEA